MALFATFVAPLMLAFSLPATAEVISDIMISETDEFSALQVKKERFWRPVMRAVEETNVDKHAQLYKDVECELATLPEENQYVRLALRESMNHLKSADQELLKNALQSSELASERMAARNDGGSSFSFFTGGQNFLKNAIRRFIDGGDYSEKVTDQIGKRQADILPLLRGAAESTGSILSDCRLASKRGFDIRKYDIYNRGVPKTPESAKVLADRLIEAAGETRKRFTSSITSMVNGITRDVQEKQEDAAAIVTRASLHASLAKVQSSLPAGQIIDL
jgi:cell division septum initiation protein DivIVA